ncbi:MAG: histidine phosphatase family protein [Planctomycetota bacterium]|nr:MAG: histidine phosphatase family protein [Planctomycetota bacterium]
MHNRYYALRHGESEANAQGIVLSDPAAGEAGYGLTPRGRSQARAAAEAFAGEGRPPRIYSSPFLRARQTAEAFAEVLGVSEVLVRAELRERFFGQLEGHPSARYEDVWRRDEEDPGHTDWGVESVVAVLGRTSALVAELEATRRGERIVLVSHGDPLQILETGLRGLNPAAHRSLPHLSPGELRRLAGRAQG